MGKLILRISLILLFFIGASVDARSQQIFSGSDLSSFSTSNLTDEDVSRYLAEVRSSGVSMEQAERIALAKGLPPGELEKLRLRINNLRQKSTQPDNTPRTNETNPERNTDAVFVNPKIFGAELFSTASLSFQPDLKIATPVNYELGPDDQLQIAIFGVQEASFNLTVSPEGVIKIPNAGEAQVSGLTVEQATSVIRNRLAAIYTSLRSGSSKLSISLGKIRSITVTVLGSTKPGTYEVSSLSSVFNVLYLSGGPNANGSYREIELLRNNKIERKIDLYSFLLNGDVAGNIRLRENDIIRIPVYKRRVEIQGEVKRAGIFELLPGETVTDLLFFTGGFTDSAYRASVKVVQLTDRERKVKDIESGMYSNYQPGSGDLFSVSKILNRFANRVTIEGAVARPGDFEITEGLTLAQLIRRADGLVADAYTERAQLIRLREDLTLEFISFNARDVMNGRADFLLKREDRVVISSIFDLQGKDSVFVQGEVRNPGSYNIPKGLTIKDLILQAGGFTDAAFPQRIELARVLRRDTLTSQDKRLSTIIDVRNINELSSGAGNITLLPFDVVTVRRLPGYLNLSSVNAVGQVQYPGPYVLGTRSERVSDLLKRAGGLTPEAFVEAAFLRRNNVRSTATEIKADAVEKIQLGLKDSSNSIVGSVQRTFDQIPLDLSRILATPGGEADLILKPGDELFVPRNDAEIRISGEVLFPTQAPYRRNENLKDYISAAGGFSDYARKKRVYVIYPNGRAAATRHFLFFKSYPDVKPGSEIIIPRYAVKIKNRTTAEGVAVITSVATLAYLIISLVKL